MSEVKFERDDRGIGVLNEEAKIIASCFQGMAKISIEIFSGDQYVKRSGESTGSSAFTRPGILKACVPKAFNDRALEAKHVKFLRQSLERRRVYGQEQAIRLILTSVQSNVIGPLPQTVEESSFPSLRSLDQVIQASPSPAHAASGNVRVSSLPFNVYMLGQPCSDSGFPQHRLAAHQELIEVYRGEIVEEEKRVNPYKV